MTRRRLAAFLRALADRLDPREPEPEVMSYADFCERLRIEKELEDIPMNEQINLALAKVGAKHGLRRVK